MSEANDTYNTIISELAPSGVVASKMFGMPTLKIGNKAFAGLRGDDMVFKLQGADHARALALSGAHLFEPREGRQMKEWVVVPGQHAPEWLDLAEKALGYVAQKA